MYFSGSKDDTPTTPFICAGDLARLEITDLDLLKACHESFGIWDENLVEVSILNTEYCYIIAEFINLTINYVTATFVYA